MKISAEMLALKKIQKALLQANQLRAKCAVIVGEKELSAGKAQVKFMESRTAKEIPLPDLVHYFTKRQFNGL